MRISAIARLLNLNHIIYDKLNIQNPEAFCLFIGYPRSGHSIVGSILDAHPQIIISHELNVLENFNSPKRSKKDLFEEILNKSKQQASLKRMSAGYSYLIPNQWNGKFKNLVLIGDKKGGRTIELISKNLNLLDQFENFVKLPLKIIHVTRNPFDCISTSVLRFCSSKNIQPNSKLLELKIRQFFSKAHIIGLLKSSGKHSIYDLAHESLIKNPSFELERLLAYLDLPWENEYIKDCCEILYDNPNQSRKRIKLWNDENISKVENCISLFDFLSKYSWQN